MSDLVLLPRADMRRIEPFVSRSRGLPRVDDRRVISGIVYVLRNDGTTGSGKGARQDPDGCVEAGEHDGAHGRYPDPK